MPVLANSRHERFAQEIVKGASQVEAYGLAGYEPVEANASRLIRNDKVAARIAELKGAAAERAVTTAEDIAAQLDEDRTFAKECRNPSAMVSASMGKAKVLGLLTEKVEHSGPDGGPIEVSDRELAELIVLQLTQGVQAT